MTIKRENMKPRTCPVCGKAIAVPFFINIYLNDGSVMPQPVCVDNIDEMRTEDVQKEVLRVCKEIWTDEINSGTTRTEEEKQKEIERIDKLEVTYRNE